QMKPVAPSSPSPLAPDEKPQQPYRSTPDSRSSVLNRAREYTKRIDEEDRRRSTSQDRNQANDLVSPTSSYRETNNTKRQTTSPGSFDQTPKSTRERALESVEKENSRNQTTTMNNSNNANPSPASTRRSRPSAATTNATGGDDDEATMDQTLQQQQPPQQQGEPVVSPELLVDALSGHEDGLLAIAERIMEHYDSGYDAMGEAIIDAFADVQKLFQHVVEAAHMEGAAFEASRREEEMKELRKKAAAYGGSVADDDTHNDPMSPNGTVRHDEFIDQDVKDCLNEAIRKGATLKDQNKHEECYEFYEQACQSASALLPVDSDHRGRLQLSIARAESMSPDRGCAILRYAMDDVLRSGLRAGKVTLPDPSKRADVVLSKPKGHPSMHGGLASGNVAQSSEEALNSLVEEMKEILDAPVYKDTPLQDVARRFWTALQDNQKISSKNEDRLEHNLGKLKGDFLLARAEWEEKLNLAQEQADLYRQKFNTVKDGKEMSLMEEARSAMAKLPQTMNEDGDTLGSLGASASFRSAANRPEIKKGVESVASMGSSLAQHAKTLVGSFACAGNNERTGQVLVSERATEEWRGRRNAANSAARDTAGAPNTQLPPGLEMSNSASTRSYRPPGAANQAPRHVDV
ncbi:MAG: hypothetical protein SGILL_008963, partial [Bacillariaceae sp.]